jgi:hypothetical protein
MGMRGQLQASAALTLTKDAPLSTAWENLVRPRAGLDSAKKKKLAPARKSNTFL